MSKAVEINSAVDLGPEAPKRLFSNNDLKKLIIPLIIEQTLTLTVGMIDTIMVASVGEDAVSGVSLVDSINLLIINLFTALAAGGAIVAGQYLGKSDRKNGNRASKQLVIASLLLSVAIMLLCLAFNQSILLLIFGKAEASVLGNARTYFYMTALTYPFVALYNASASLFRVMGNSKIAMVNALIMNLVNIVGNAFFIYWMQLGVFGAAFATLISRAIAATTMIWMLRNPNLKLYARKYRLKDIELSMIKRILKIGIPNGLENSMFQIGKIIVASLVATMGTTAMAANAVGNSIAMIEIIPGFALGMAIITVVSQCVGANDYEQSTYYIKYLMKKTYLYMFVLNVVMLLMLKPILGMYQLLPETYDTAWQLSALHGFFAITIWPLAFTLPNAFRAAGDAKFTMTISIISMWAFRVGLSYVFANFFALGVLGVWIAMIVDWVFRSIFFLWRLISGKWKKAAIV